VVKVGATQVDPLIEFPSSRHWPCLQILGLAGNVKKILALITEVTIIKCVASFKSNLLLKNDS
jgi:hypothetical protein